MELIVLDTIGTLGTAAATISLVILLFRTVRQMESSVRLSQIQTTYRFRPWLGPFGGIKFLGTDKGNHQFDLTIKNFGELPANSVTVYFKNDLKKFSRELDLGTCKKFNLGPMLPNMEKHYWIFIESNIIESTNQGKEKLFTFLYLEYPASSGKSGYGMISEYLHESNNFMHIDMWIDNPESNI